MKQDKDYRDYFPQYGYFGKYAEKGDWKYFVPIILILLIIIVILNY